VTACGVRAESAYGSTQLKKGTGSVMTVSAETTARERNSASSHFFGGERAQGEGIFRGLVSVLA
jgi:hypothetical protein